MFVIPATLLVGIATKLLRIGYKLYLLHLLSHSSASLLNKVFAAKHARLCRCLIVEPLSAMGTAFTGP